MREAAATASCPVKGQRASKSTILVLSTTTAARQVYLLNTFFTNPVYFDFGRKRLTA